MDDLKAAIEAVRQYCTGYTSTVPSVDLEATLAPAPQAQEGGECETDRP